MEQTKDNAFAIFQIGKEEVTLHQSGEITVSSGITPVAFYVQNTSLVDAYGHERSEKTYPTFLAAFRSVIRRAKQRTTYGSYVIEFECKDRDDETHTLYLCFIKKHADSDEIKIEHPMESDITIPLDWFPQKRKWTGVVEEQIAELKERYNIEDVIFRNSITQSKQLTFFNEVYKYFIEEAREYLRSASNYEIAARFFEALVLYQLKLKELEDPEKENQFVAHFKAEEIEKLSKSLLDYITAAERVAREAK